MRKTVLAIAILGTVLLGGLNASDVSTGADVFLENSKPAATPIASSSETALDVSVRSKSEQTQTVPVNYDLKADYEASKQPNAPPAASAAAPADAAPATSSEPVPESGSGCGCDTSKWAVEPFGGGYRSIRHHEDIYQFGVAIEYRLLSKLQLKGEFVGLGVQEHAAQSSLGAGFNFITRYTPFSTWNGKLAMFIEGGAGVNEFTHRTPAPSGTHFNFSPQGGLGGIFNFTDKLSIVVAGRYLHISNANIEGDHRGWHRNPGCDTAGGYAGVQIRF